MFGAGYLNGEVWVEFVLESALWQGRLGQMRPDGTQRRVRWKGATKEQLSKWEPSAAQAWAHKRTSLVLTHCLLHEVAHSSHLREHKNIRPSYVSLTFFWKLECSVVVTALLCIEIHLM